MDLCFTQQVYYKNLILDKQITDTFKDGSTKHTGGQTVTRDIWVKNNHLSYTIDEKTIECDVPVLINNVEKDNPQKMGSAITYAKEVWFTGIVRSWSRRRWQIQHQVYPIREEKMDNTKNL
jgi:hypothetical protein